MSSFFGMVQKGSKKGNTMIGVRHVILSFDGAKIGVKPAILPFRDLF